MTLLLVALAALAVERSAPAQGLIPLKVLYVGEAPTSARATQFTAFLQKRVSTVDAVSRKEFQPAQAVAFDVVLLDWPQSAHDLGKNAPLGERAAWTRPTVLLGSAGLNLAIAWQIRGGSG